jgi:hypothetical protein
MSGIPMTTLRIAAAVSSLLMATAPVHASSDYLLQLDPVKGAGKDAAAPQTIDVQSFSWGVSNSGHAVSSSGAGAGKVNMQDISMTSVQSPRDVATGQASGKRVVTAAVADGQASPVAASPKVGDDATFTVVIRESPSRPSSGKADACAVGTHFPHAVVVADGRRYELTDVVETACATAGGQTKKNYTGHITLMK